MAEEKSIPLILTVDGSKAIKTVGELKKGIADTRKELEKTEIGSKRFDELSESVKKAEGRLGELNKQSVALKDMGGPIGAIAKGFDEARTAIIRGATAMKTLSGALAATGIGALLVAFGSLMAYFKGTEEGAQRLRVIMAVLGAVSDQIKEVFIQLGKRLFDTFSNPKQALIDFGNLIKENIMNRMEGLVEFIPAVGKAIGLALKGEWSEAGKVALDATAKVTLGVENLTDKIGNAANAVKDFAAQVAAAAKEGAELENALNRVLVAERALRVERAEANKTIVALKVAAKDLNLSLEERIAALTKANAIEDELLQRELANERERLRIMQAKADMASSDEATLDAIADQQVKVANIEQASLQKRVELGEQLNSLRRAEAAEEAARVEAARKLAEEQAAFEMEQFRAIREAKAKIIEDDEQRELKQAEVAFETRMEDIIKKYGKETELIKLLDEERAQALADIRQKYIDKELAEQDKRNKDLLRKEEELKAGKIAAAQAVAGALGTIASAIQGESEAAVTARKVLAIAQIAIDTGIAISGAIAQAQSVPFPANIAAIATGVAAVVAGIANAVNTLNSAQVGGGSAPAPSAPNVSAPSVNPVTTNTTQLNNTEQAELAPIQAYVVETQLTGSQNNVNQIESQATFGGG
jgi:hypothetical protein